MAAPHRRIARLIAVGTALFALATGAGSQDLSRPPAATAAVDVVGATLRARLPDGTTLEGRALAGAVLIVALGGRDLRIRIAAVEPDPQDRAGEVLLYDFRV